MKYIVFQKYENDTPGRDMTYLKDGNDTPQQSICDNLWIKVAGGTNSW